MLMRCGTAILLCATLAALACRERIPATPPQNLARRNVPPSPPAAPPTSSPFQYPIYSFPQRTPPNEPALNPEVLPRVLRRVDPEYTPEAKKARIAGIVVVEVIVERDCRVGAARVLKPLPFGLSQKAVEAVRQWRFSPATHEGKPIRAFFTVTVDFRPEDE